MDKKYVAINKLLLMLEIADVLENHPSIIKITDEDGKIVIPEDRYPDFAYDFGLIMGRILGKLCEHYD